MEGNQAGPTTIDEYIAGFSPEVRERLRTVRAVIRGAAPEATEKISWGMPTFVLHGNLIHFAAHKQHIGLYPGAEAMEAFGPRLVEYKTSKGAVQLPHGRPLPGELVAEITRFCVAANTARAQSKPKKTK